MIKATTAIEAVAEAWAEMHEYLDEFQQERALPDYDEGCGTYGHCLREAAELIAMLAKRGWTLTPGPTVNAGEEVA
jgi:hypothetical protein